MKWALRPPTGGTTFTADLSKVEELLTGLGLSNVRFRLREFPFLADLYASAGSAWALNLRNSLSRKPAHAAVRDRAWVFADKPPVA